MKGKFLIVDDDLAITGKFKILFDEMGLEAEFASSYEEVLPLLKKDAYSYAGIFLDHNLKDKNGKSIESLSLVPLIREINPFLVLVMISGDRSEENLKKWLNLSLDKFLYKPIEAGQIKALSQYALNKFEKEFKSDLGNNLNSLADEEKEAIEKVGIIAQSKQMARVCVDVIKFSKTDASVVLLGETGTGKELLAKAIHRNSKRVDLPFLVLNCSSYNNNADLLESELFGHLKGSFTGAEKDKKGIFEKANGGTVFLDEIHNLCLDAQAKLLRVLQENKIRRVGDFIEKTVEFTLVCAAKPELIELVNAKNFLPDLYYRIVLLDIKIPPLRERNEDIIPLIKYFIEINTEKYKKTKTFTNSAIQSLRLCSWPGNVRELESMIESVFIKIDKNMITAKELGANFESKMGSFSSERASYFQRLVLKHKKEQKLFILETLDQVDFNTAQGAKSLSIPRTSLISKMKALGLDGFNRSELQGIFRKESLFQKGEML